MGPGVETQTIEIVIGLSIMLLGLLQIRLALQNSLDNNNLHFNSNQ